MADISDLKLHHRVFVERYPFSRYEIKDNPSAGLSKPLSQTKFALVTSAGLMLENDRRFDNLIKLGDPSFREIPNDTDVQQLVEDHDSSTFDHSGIDADKNLAFPLDRFHELESAGLIGSLNVRHFSFMGSIISPSRLIKETAPNLAKLLIEDEVDAVFLTPV